MVAQYYVHEEKRWGKLTRIFHSVSLSGAGKRPFSELCTGKCHLVVSFGTA